MYCEVVAEVQPGAVQARTVLGELLRIPWKVSSYLREHLKAKSVVCFLATKCAAGLVASRVVRVVGSVEGYEQGGVVVVEVPNIAGHRSITTLRGRTYAGSDVAPNVVIEGEAMLAVARMVGFRSGLWLFGFYLKSASGGRYVVNDPLQIRTLFNRRPVATTV